MPLGVTVSSAAPAKQPGPGMTTAILHMSPLTFADLPRLGQRRSLGRVQSIPDDLRAGASATPSQRELAAAPDATADVITADAKSAQLVRKPAAPPRRSSGRHSAAAKVFFETHFHAAPRSCTTGNAGMLTGYYEPVLEGSRTPHGRVPDAPIYRRPPDLVNVVAETERASASVSGPSPTCAGPKGRRAVLHPRPDRSGCSQGQGARAALFARPGRRLLHPG